MTEQKRNKTLKRLLWWLRWDLRWTIRDGLRRTVACVLPPPLAKQAEDWRRWQFLLLPYRGWDDEVPPLSSLLIMPTGRKHDSGFRVINVVGTTPDGGVYPFKLTGCSDVIHIEGIGGFGHHWLERYGSVPRAVPPREWSIDVMRNGVVRLFGRGPIAVGAALSSLEVYSEPERSKMRQTGSGND